MIMAKKVRIIPSIEQEQKLWQSVGTARFIYNWTLARQQENYKNGGKFISNNDLRKEITLMKQMEELKWLNNVSNNVAKQAVKDGCDAYKRLFKGFVNKPRFKSRKRSKPSFYNDTSKLKVNKDEVLIEKEQPVVELTTESIGIDVGVKDLAICSNGMIFKNLGSKFFQKSNKLRLAKAFHKMAGHKQKSLQA